jgi:hypothetical protein
MGLRLCYDVLATKKHKVYLILTTFVHSEDNKTSLLLFSPKENNTNLFRDTTLLLRQEECMFAIRCGLKSNAVLRSSISFRWLFFISLNSKLFVPIKKDIKLHRSKKDCSK